MRSYRDTMEDLRFSPEEKAAMTQALLQAAASAPAKTKRRKKAALIAVAAVTAALCAACATGVLQDAVAALSTRFGATPAQMEIIQEFTHPVMASDTDNGITVTIEAVLGGSDRSYLLCRMAREDGQPVVKEEVLSPADPNVRYQIFSFEKANFQGTLGSSDADPVGFSAELGSGPEFLTDATDGHDLYFFFDLFWYGEKFPAGEMTLLLKNLSCSAYSFPDGAQGEPEIQTTLLVEGEWEFSFTFPQEAQVASIELADGQTFHPGIDPSYATTGTLQSLRLSPLLLILECTYTADEAAMAEAAASYDPTSNFSQDAWIRMVLTDDLLDTSYLTFKDGTKRTFQQMGGQSGNCTELGQYHLIVFFNEILPLDTVASVTIGDLTIPMP